MVQASCAQVYLFSTPGLLLERCISRVLNVHNRGGGAPFLGYNPMVLNILDIPLFFSHDLTSGTQPGMRITVRTVLRLTPEESDSSIHSLVY